MRSRRWVTAVVCIVMAGLAGAFSNWGTARLFAVPQLCPRTQVCEDYAAGCKTIHQGCSLSDTGLQECQFAPGETFSCGGSHTIHIKTCPCQGTCGGQATGTELVCS
jgi:hypothetical protein